MYYKFFMFRAALDWLDLEIRTLHPHPAWRLRHASAGMFSYVTGLDCVTGQNIRFVGRQGANTPTTRFAVRIQNPERFASVMAALAAVADLDPSFIVLVRGLELALDAHRRERTMDQQLVEMTSHMIRAINRPKNANEAPRFYSVRGTPDHRYGDQQARVAIQDGKTAMYGNRDDNYIVRGYLKDYDTQPNEQGKPQRINLPNPLQHRARIEVRLQGAACPVKTLDDLRGFKFESLASPYFKFHEPSDESMGVEALVANKKASLGSVVDQAGNVKAAHANRGRLRKTVRGSRASPLNEIVRDQLRKLTLRWRCEAGRKRRRHNENSGTKEVSGHAPNYLNVQCRQPKEIPYQSGEVAPSSPETPLPETCASSSGVLNTSLPALASHLSLPIKVASGITPYPDLQPLLDDLNHPDSPTLPDLTGDPAEV